MYKIGLLVFLLVLSSCTKGELNDPKNRLKDYIARSFSIKKSEDKAYLMEYLTGDVKARLGGWSEDQFREAFMDSKRQFEKLLFREVKEVSATEVQVTYELTYLDQGRGRDGQKHDARITTKKLCQMVLDKGKWFISDVKNIKELVEYKDEMSLP